MKVGTLFLILAFLLGNHKTAVGQINAAKHDNVWIFGFGSWGHSFMSFEADSLKIIKKKPAVIDLGDPSIMMSDKNGQLLFYTNGVTILNRNNSVMKNGKRINPGKFIDKNGWTMEGLPVNQSCLGLSFPGNDSIYYIVHQDLWDTLIDGERRNFAPFYYSKINMSEDNGFGEVVQLNNSINKDSVSAGNLTACRHANGRDWWIVQKLPYQQVSNAYLVTEDTILFMHKIANTPTVKSREPYGQSFYSQNGTKYFSVSCPVIGQAAFFDIYDFDRCTGTMSNNNRIIFTNNYGNLVIGGAISPSGKYLYVTRYNQILQFDLEAADISSSVDTVAVFDGFKSPTTGCPTTFHLAQLGPDGKIYISCGPCTSEYLTVISSPDKRGKECGVKQHSVNLIAANLFMIPNIPNYRLGPLKGSPCDTITVATKELSSADYGLKIFPNPAAEQIQIDITLPNYDPTTKTEVILVDLSGEIVQRYIMPDFAYLATLDISKLPSGVYGVQLRQRDKVMAVEKLVVIR